MNYGFIRWTFGHLYGSAFVVAFYELYAGRMETCLFAAGAAICFFFGDVIYTGRQYANGRAS